MRSLLLLGSVIEARDPYTGGHVWRVAQLARLLGMRLDLDEESQLHLALGALMHDFGKISIPDEVLRKHGPLTVEEFDLIKTHPEMGARLLQDHPLGHLVLDVVMHHHGWLDGRGYPARTARTLSLPVQIVGLVDTFDALTSARPYHEAKSIRETLSIIDQERGSHFDSDLVETMWQLAANGDLDPVVLHSFPDRPLVHCPGCGPVIVLGPDDAPGDVVPCPACLGLFELHLNVNMLEAEFTGEYVPPSRLVPTPDTEAIDYHLGALALV
ncbi:MAG: HD domain-containing phosphohydrolase [Candidatus Hydrogenedentales bacterium]